MCINIAHQEVEAASVIHDTQITATTNLSVSTFPGIAPLSVDRIVDGIVSDAPPRNGFVSPVSFGTIRLELDRVYNLDSFLLWNDVVIEGQGISEFSLNFLDIRGTTIQTLSSNANGAFIGPRSQFESEEYFFDSTISGVKTVELIVESTHGGAIELREVAFTGNPSVNLCCPPWSEEKLSTAFQATPEKGGGLFSDYTLPYQNVRSANLQMNAYVNYLKLVIPSVTSLDVAFTLTNHGNADLPMLPGSLVTSTSQNPMTLKWTGRFMRRPSFWSDSPFLIVNEWYKISSKVEVKDEGNQELNILEEDCINAGIFYRIQVSNMRMRSSTGRVLQISDGKTILKTVPIK